MSIRFDDALTTRGTGDVSDAEAWFDRAYFNIFAGIDRPWCWGALTTRTPIEAEV